MTAQEVYDDSMERYGFYPPPDLYVQTSCGRCSYCEKKRMREYRIRLIHELQDYPNSLFITLTFDDDNLNKYKDDTNKPVRLFLDLMRKKYGKGIRHWIICEYGTLHGRPHYHGLLFNLPDNPDWPKAIESTWKYGFVYVGYATEKTCNYICKYITKGTSGKRSPPRVLTSNGIGLSYLKDKKTVKFHCNPSSAEYRNYIPYHGYKVPLPRYYSSKIYDDVDRAVMAVQLFDKKLDEPFEGYVNGLRYDNQFDYTVALRNHFEFNKRLNLSFDRKPSNPKENIFNRFQNYEIFKTSRLRERCEEVGLPLE